jgi:Flp pilus assembly protein TadD
MLLLLSFLATADAKRNSLANADGGAEESDDGTAPWETKEGAEKTKIEMADALIKTGNPQGALSLIAEMRKAGSTLVELDVLQGKALRKLGLYDDADDILRGAIKHHPRCAGAHNELGLLLLERKQVDEAVPELKAAAKQDSDNADFLNNYGFALITAGKTEAAIVPLRAALKIDGTRERTRNNLGFALVANDKPDEAYRLFRSSQTEGDAHYNVGYGLELRGEREKALMEYHSALASDPKHKLSIEAIYRLDPFAKQAEGPPSAAPLPAMINDPETP